MSGSGNSTGRVPVFKPAVVGSIPTHCMSDEASVAQMAEQSFCKRQVAGSMPARGL